MRRRPRKHSWCTAGGRRHDGAFVFPFDARNRFGSVMIIIRVPDHKRSLLGIPGTIELSQSLCMEARRRGTWDVVTCFPPLLGPRLVILTRHEVVDLR